MSKIKELTKFLSQKQIFDYLNSSIDASQRKLRLAELKEKFESQSRVSSINFSNSGYVEDSTGVPNFLDEDFTAERALSEIKRHLIKADIEKTLTGQINAKNAIIKRNKERKADIQESFAKKY